MKRILYYILLSFSFVFLTACTEKGNNASEEYTINIDYSDESIDCNFKVDKDTFITESDIIMYLSSIENISLINPGEEIAGVYLDSEYKNEYEAKKIESDITVYIKIKDVLEKEMNSVITIYYLDNTISYNYSVLKDTMITEDDIIKYTLSIENIPSINPGEEIAGVYLDNEYKTRYVTQAINDDITVYIKIASYTLCLGDIINDVMINSDIIIVSKDYESVMRRTYYTSKNESILHYLDLIIVKDIDSDVDRYKVINNTYMISSNDFSLAIREIESSEGTYLVDIFINEEYKKTYIVISGSFDFLKADFVIDFRIELNPFDYDLQYIQSISSYDENTTSMIVYDVDSFEENVLSRYNDESLQCSEEETRLKNTYNEEYFTNKGIILLDLYVKGIIDYEIKSVSCEGNPVVEINVLNYQEADYFTHIYHLIEFDKEKYYDAMFEYDRKFLTTQSLNKYSMLDREKVIELYSALTKVDYLFTSENLSKTVIKTTSGDYEVNYLNDISLEKELTLTSSDRYGSLSPNEYDDFTEYFQDLDINKNAIIMSKEALITYLQDVCKLDIKKNSSGYTYITELFNDKYFENNVLIIVKVNTSSSESGLTLVDIEVLLSDEVNCRFVYRITSPENAVTDLINNGTVVGLKSLGNQEIYTILSKIIDIDLSKPLYFENEFIDIKMINTIDTDKGSVYYEKYTDDYKDYFKLDIKKVPERISLSSFESPVSSYIGFATLENENEILDLISRLEKLKLEKVNTYIPTHYTIINNHPTISLMIDIYKVSIFWDNQFAYINISKTYNKDYGTYKVLLEDIMFINEYFEKKPIKEMINKFTVDITDLNMFTIKYENVIVSNFWSESIKTFINKLNGELKLKLSDLTVSDINNLTNTISFDYETYSIYIVNVNNKDTKNYFVIRNIVYEITDAASDFESISTLLSNMTFITLENIGTNKRFVSKYLKPDTVYFNNLNNPLILDNYSYKSIEEIVEMFSVIKYSKVHDNLDTSKMALLSIRMAAKSSVLGDINIYIDENNHGYLVVEKINDEDECYCLCYEFIINDMYKIKVIDNYNSILNLEELTSNTHKALKTIQVKLSSLSNAQMSILVNGETIKAKEVDTDNVQYYEFIMPYNDVTIQIVCDKVISNENKDIIYYENEISEVLYTIIFDYEINETTYSLHKEFASKYLNDLDYESIFYYKNSPYIFIYFNSSVNIYTIDKALNVIKSEHKEITNFRCNIYYIYDSVYMHNPKVYGLTDDDKITFELTNVSILPKGIYKSKEEVIEAVNNYFEKNKDSYIMTREESIRNDLLDLYNDEYFDENYLIVTDTIVTGSGSNKQYLQQAYFKDGKIYFFVKMYFVSLGTCDIQETIFGVKIAKDLLVNEENIEQILLYENKKI